MTRRCLAARGLAARLWRLSLGPLCLALAVAMVAGCGNRASDLPADAGPGERAGDGRVPDGRAVDRPGGDGGPGDASRVDGRRPDAGCPDGGCPDGRPGSTVVDCPGAPPTPPPAGSCTLTPGSGSQLLVRGTVLAPGRVLRGGQLLVVGGKIACAECDCSAVPGATAAARLECGDGVVSPGLINAHDHITFTTNTPKGHADERYEHRHDWRKGKRGHTKISVSSNTGGDDGTRFGELRQVMAGTTSLFGSGGTAGLVRNLDKANLLEGLPDQAAKYETFPLGDSDGDLLASGCAYPGIDQASSIASLDAYVPHISEGIDVETRNEFLCVSRSEGGAEDLVQPQSAFIHSIGLIATDIEMMAKEGTAMVWSPRSNIDLYGNTAQVTVFARRGATIALGSDWTASGSMNILRELRCVDSFNRGQLSSYFSDEELWKMVTRGAAEVMAMDDSLGSFAVGLQADVAIFASHGQGPFRTVLDAEPADVLLVLRGGLPLYGEATLIAGLAPSSGEGCEEIDVCGAKRRLCAKRETGKTLADLRSKVGAAYDLFFCGEPDSEPSCVPFRKGEYDGQVTATDRDGDGVADGQDNCPSIFNPVRPLDGTKQADFDGDGEGDACDPCPLNPGTSQCGGFDPNDLDGDTIPNHLDNCRDLANADQADRDRDGKGDVCDPCPDYANPGSAACALSIRELRDPGLGKRPPAGTAVTVAEATVLAVRTTRAGNFGFYITDADGADYSGLFVFTRDQVPATSGGDQLRPGDVVRVTGAFTEWSNTDQIERPSDIARTGSGGNLTPRAVATAELTPGSASAEKLESLLVVVRNVSVRRFYAADPAAGADEFYVSDQAGNDCSSAAGAYPACTLVGDFFYDGGNDDNNLPAVTLGEALASITGVVNGYRNEHSLDVRSDADLVRP